MTESNKNENIIVLGLALMQQCYRTNYELFHKNIKIMSYYMPISTQQ